MILGNNPWVFWSVGALCYVVSFLLAFRRKPPRATDCSWCGYDLSGNDASDLCPECGADAIDRKARAAQSRMRPALIGAAIPIGVSVLVSLVALFIFLGGPVSILAIPLFGAFIVATYVPCAVVAVIAGHRSTTPAKLASIVAIAGALGTTIVTCWLMHLAFVQHPDPQSALIIVFLPVWSPAGGSILMLIALVIVRAIDW